MKWARNEKDPTSAQFYAELLYHYREEVKDAVTLPDKIKELINKPITSVDIKNITTFISYILPNADGEFAYVLKNVALILPKFVGKSRKELLAYIFKLFIAGVAP